MRVFGLLLLFAGTIYCDVYSCGGFVKSSSKVDYGQLQVRLLTPEGHLKYETDVNTQNGYYMIPVYNKASYSLRVFAPNGWYFEPERYEIKVDGQTDACSKNEDINFQLIAFAIEGAVVSGDAGDGPVGLELTLSQNGKTVAKTKTTKGGTYHFKAPPGKYEVSTGADSSFCLERSNAQVEVVSGPVKVEPAIRIRGYELVVESKRGTSPLAGVEIQIFSEHHPRLEKCSRLASLPAGVPSSAVHSCRLGVTGDTELRVKCLPPGRYYVTANYELNGVEYSFEPNVKTLDMGAAAAKIAFSVLKFSAKARVTVAGRAFPGVTVLLEDKPAGKTDQDGYVRLYGLKEGPVKITAQAERTFFSTVQDKLALPNINIPSVVVLGFDVCGSVEKGPHSERATLHLKNKKGGDSFTIRVQNDGSFCKLAPPALYSLEPSDGDSALAPRSIEVDLTNGPKTGYRFTHFKADVSAKASCIGPCEGVSISLLNSDGREVAKKQSSNAVFEGISPGKYNLLVEDGGRLCWESSTLPVSFEHAAPETVTFVQSGFNLRLKLSHPAEIKWVHSEKKQLQGTLAGTPGVQSICLPSEGRYTFSPSACHTFADARFDISVPYSGDTIRVQAVEAKISVRVEGGDAGVKLLVKSASGEREVSATSGGIFTWNQAVSSAGPLTLVPKSSLFLFDPTSRTVNFVGTCIDEAAIFKAEKGIFIDGEIRPAVADVAIRAVFNADENVRIENSSDKNGKFRIGPLRKADDVRIEAEKEGYAFSKGDKPGLLNSVRLSQLQVTVVEVIGEDGKQGEKLGGVLLSVVGGGQGGAQTYRTNSIVDETGKINFVGLAPGEYFLRPILQEFRFEPSTTTITIREGEIEAVTLKARRYAYSAFGRVRQLSGAASKGTTVEAFSEACAQSQEEAVTDDEGNFRVRALKPDCTYRISVKAAAHTYPSHYEVDMTAEHVNKLHFVLTPIEERTEVGGEVVWEGKGDVPPPATYRVRLLRREDVLETLILESPTRLFYLTNLSKDGSEYRIRIEPTSNSPSLSFAPVEEVITADASWKSLRLIVTWPPRRGADVEISRGSLLAPPFFALLALIFFNQNRALELLKSFVLRLERPNSPAPPQDAARKKRKVA